MGLLLAQQRGDWEGAERWWQRAADAGEGRAMYSIGVVRNRQGDPREAEHWFRRAAAAGYAPSD
jgi:hypothetical protein